MKNTALLAVAVVSVLLSGPSAVGQDASAVNVQTSCAHWSRLRVDKRREFKGSADDMYQTGVCLGYFEGLMDGMDNTGGWRQADSTQYSFFQIKRSAVASEWDVIRSFYSYVDANPLAKGKPAWSILQSVLITNGLATFVPQKEQGEASVLNSECKTGANNVITLFSSDVDLKAIDTQDLASVDEKLQKCLGTDGLTTTDSALLLGAQSEASFVLLGRAINVLDRHDLLPELQNEHSSSSQNIPVSHTHALTREH
jgi:hypothetical protein